MADPNDNTLEPLDRGIPNVNRERANPYVKGAVILGVVCLTALSVVVGWWKLGTDTDFGIEQPPEMTRAATVPPRTFPTIVDEPEPEPEPVIAQAKPTQPIVPAVQPLPIQPRPIQPRPTPKAKPPMPDKSRSTLMSASTDARQRDQTVDVAPVRQSDGDRMTVAQAFGGNRRESSSDSDLSDRLTPTRLNATAATMLPNSQLTLPQGAYIPCALRSRLDSTVTGLTSCTVTQDVYSNTGDVLLVDRGSVINGEYRSNLRQGQQRIFVLWTRLKTPEDVVIDLNSPATGSLGQTGVGGHVDTHFWQRFGGALMLSLVDDIAREITEDDDGDDTSIVIGSSADTAATLAAEVLRNTINIAPTLYAHHGAEVGVYVARDLDFSSVYSLSALQ